LRESRIALYKKTVALPVHPFQLDLPHPTSPEEIEPRTTATAVGQCASGYLDTKDYSLLGSPH
jgi:hypothetical protein